MRQFAALSFSLCSLDQLVSNSKRRLCLPREAHSKHFWCVGDRQIRVACVLYVLALFPASICSNVLLAHSSSISAGSIFWLYPLSLQFCHLSVSCVLSRSFKSTVCIQRSERCWATGAIPFNKDRNLRFVSLLLQSALVINLIRTICSWRMA